MEATTTTADAAPVEAAPSTTPATEERNADVTAAPAATASSTGTGRGRAPARSPPRAPRSSAPGARNAAGSSGRPPAPTANAGRAGANSATATGKQAAAAAAAPKAASGVAYEDRSRPAPASPSRNVRAAGSSSSNAAAPARPLVTGSGAADGLAATPATAPAHPTSSVDRVLAVSHVHGRISELDALCTEHSPVAVLAVGNFGLFEYASYERLDEGSMEKPRDGEHSVLRAKLASVSLSPAERDVVAAGGSELRALARQKAALGQVPALLEGETRLGVPVYVIWGEEDDIRVIERLRATTSLIPNLHLIDERSAPLVGSLRIFGFGGGFAFGSFFNIGDGAEALGGDEATARTWATAWQIGVLLELAQRMASHARRETVVLATSVSAAAEPAVVMLAASLKANITVAPSASTLAYCFLSEDLGDGHGGQLAATEARILSSQTAMSKLWPDVRDVLLKSADARHMDLIQRTMAALASPLAAADFANRIHLALPPVISAGAHALVCTDRTTGVVTLLPTSRGPEDVSSGVCAGVALAGARSDLVREPRPREDSHHRAQEPPRPAREREPREDQPEAHREREGRDRRKEAPPARQREPAKPAERKREADREVGGPRRAGTEPRRDSDAERKSSSDPGAAPADAAKAAADKTDAAKAPADKSVAAKAPAERSGDPAGPASDRARDPPPPPRSKVAAKPATPKVNLRLTAECTEDDVRKAVAPLEVRSIEFDSKFRWCDLELGDAAAAQELLRRKTITLGGHATDVREWHPKTETHSSRSGGPRPTAPASDNPSTAQASVNAGAAGAAAST